MLGKMKSIFIKRKETEVINNEAEEQRRNLILGLKAVFVIIPLLKPYNKEEDLVKVPNEHINIILRVLKSDDNKIIQNKLFFDVKKCLEEIIDNDGIFKIDETFLEKANMVQRFCHSVLN